VTFFLSSFSISEESKNEKEEENSLFLFPPFFFRLPPSLSFLYPSATSNTKHQTMKQKRKNKNR